MNTAQAIGRLQSLGKPLLSDDVERKSVKEKDGHFTARGQRARCTVADCGPIVGCGSRPAFVDLRDTLSCARARPRCFHAPRGGGERAQSRKLRKVCTTHGYMGRFTLLLSIAFMCNYYRKLYVHITLLSR